MEKAEKVLSPEKKEVYEKLCDGTPDALFVLARRVRTAGEAERQKTGGYSQEETDFHGNIGGSHANIIAASELAIAFPQAKLVTNSYVEKTDEDHAEIERQELLRKGITEERIVTQKNSFSSLTELFELVRLINENKWKHVVVITNEFHIPRVKAMLERIDTVQPANSFRDRPHVRESIRSFKASKEVRVSFVAAEAVLPVIDQRYQNIIEAARLSDAWKKTLKVEEEGLRMVLDGTYGQTAPATSIKTYKT